MSRVLNSGFELFFEYFPQYCVHLVRIKSIRFRYNSALHHEFIAERVIVLSVATAYHLDDLMEFFVEMRL